MITAPAQSPEKHCYAQDKIGGEKDEIQLRPDEVARYAGYEVEYRELAAVADPVQRFLPRDGVARLTRPTGVVVFDVVETDFSRGPEEADIERPSDFIAVS